MISKASVRYIRISARKARLVADMVRGKPIDEARAILENAEKRARLYILEILNAAVANATSKDPDITPSDMYVSKITIDNGPMFKRYRAGTMGRAMQIRHRTSHMNIELDIRGQRTPGHQNTRTPVKKTEKKAGRPKIKGQIAKKETKPKTKKAVASKKGK
ncbi:MAG: 50S ribosomal protein L22 [Candidatus Omnitrophica bacterium]|nr:50S ribosomal protein L22 [Candidatus Omnitrophota bacterium]